MPNSYGSLIGSHYIGNANQSFTFESTLNNIDGQMSESRYNKIGRSYINMTEPRI